MAAGSTMVEYNGVTFWNCLTKQFRQEIVLDDSGTDPLYSKFTIRVAGYVHGDAVSTTVVGPVFVNAGLSHTAIRRLLGEVRGAFRMTVGATNSTGVGGTVILEALPAGVVPPKLADLDNGPRCKSFEIMNIAGNHVFRVEAEFEIARLECGTAAGADSNVLSNRWSCADSINENFYTTRTYTGRLRLATGHGTSPQAFRGIVVPPIQPGLRRKQMEFSATADGLSLDYTIVDEEVAFAAPEPATDWNYMYSETTGDGMIATGEAAVTLRGDRDCNKKVLIRLAAAFLEAKLVRQPAVGAMAQQTFEYLTISEETGSGQDNLIRASGKVLHATNAPGEIDAVQLEQMVTVSRLGRPVAPADWGAAVILYDANISRGGDALAPPPIEGPVPLVGAFIAYLQSPCSDLHGIAGQLIPTARHPVSGPSIDVRVRESIDEPDESADYLSESHRTAIYTYWQSQSTYEEDQHKVQLPVAASNGSTGSSDDADQPTSVVVSLGNPTVRRIIRIKGERVGAFPELPAAVDYQDGNVNAVLLSRVLLPSTPERTPDGQVLYRVEAEYVFALDRPLSALAQLRLGRNPWDNIGQHIVVQSRLSDNQEP